MALAQIEQQEDRTFDMLDDRPLRPTQLTRWRDMLTESAHVIGIHSNEHVVEALKDAFMLVYDYRLGHGGVDVDSYVYALKRFERANASLLVRGFEAAAIALICGQALLEREEARD